MRIFVMILSLIDTISTYVSRKRALSLSHTWRLKRRVYSVLLSLWWNRWRIYEMQMHGFSRRVAIGAFNKLAIFLVRFRHRTHQLALRFYWALRETRRKALLMRSLIQPISECFACPDRTSIRRDRRPPDAPRPLSLAAKRDSISSTILSLFLSLFLTAHLNELAFSTLSALKIPEAKRKLFRNFLSPEFFKLFPILYSIYLFHLFSVEKCDM